VGEGRKAEGLALGLHGRRVRPTVLGRGRGTTPLLPDAKWRIIQNVEVALDP
jgi:hypothetical protein